MLLPVAIGLACIPQLCWAAVAFPNDQQPLILHSPKSARAIQAALKEAQIIPTVIHDFLPSLTVSVSWPKKDAELGNTIKPQKLQHQPSITLHNITSPGVPTNMSYVVTLTDPDAPSRDNPEWSEMCHWIATNISLSQSSPSLPDDVVEYKPPGPPPKTGKHRYVFLIFAPKNGTAEPLHLTKPKDRQHWGTGVEGGGVKNWAQANELVPVAANFIYSQHKKQEGKVL